MSIWVQHEIFKTPEAFLDRRILRLHIGNGGHLYGRVSRDLAIPAHQGRSAVESAGNSAGDAVRAWLRAVTFQFLLAT